VIFACAACGAISPRRYRSEPGASNKRPNSDGRGYGAAFNAARDQLLANKPMCAKGCGTLADTAQHNPSAGSYGPSGRRQSSRSSRRFAPRSRRERPLHGRRPILEGSEGPPRGGRTLQYSPNRCPASINASTGPSCGASTDIRVAELAHYPAHRYACCRGANMSRLEVGGAVGGARDPQWGQGGRGPRCAC
jgi:hypothetical protein